MADKVVVSLDAILSRVAGHVAIAGIEYPVKAISAPGLQMVARIDSDDSPTFDELLALAKRLCPTLPASAWEDGSTEIVGVVIGVSQALIQRVEAELPNSSGPTTPLSPADEGTNALHAS